MSFHALPVVPPAILLPVFLSAAALCGFSSISLRAPTLMHSACRNWNLLADVGSDVAYANFIGTRTTFNIHTNKYRLIARINYRTKRVFIL